jgi:hypothetical protein
MDKATAERLLENLFNAKQLLSSNNLDEEDRRVRLFNYKEAHSTITSALTQPPVVEAPDTISEIHSMAVQARIRGMMLDPNLVITAIESKPTVEAKPQGESIKAAFMEGIAVYELGPCDGKPMSEEQIEKCWDLSDAKEAARVPTDRLLEAAKAVMDWYRERPDIKQSVFEKLNKAIEAQRKDSSNG